MAITVPVNQGTEDTMRAACTIDVSWDLLERFSSLVRLSGSDEERQAFDYIAARLDHFGVPYALETTTQFISWPLAATLRVAGDDGATFMAKTPAMSVSTGGREMEAEAVYLATGYASGVSDFFTAKELPGGDLTGKIVITEGMAMPTKVGEIAARGAIAAVFVGPGERIHEGISTTIWGSPDLDSIDRQPAIPIISVNRPHGLDLIERAKSGNLRLAYSTNLDTRWRPIPILVTEIHGATLPGEFVLVQAHLDSWHAGIGDNATGNAALLELARVLHQHRDQLQRSVRLAWWSGHSHGRYAGSTWYADTHAIDLDENGVAQVNCDSPGCRWATVYDNMMWTEEAAPLVISAVRDVTGVEPTWTRPLRAGDYSFNNLGLSGAFMLSSTMPDDLRAEKGYYPVGGCGANIAWHTEDDTLEIADRDHLLRDIRVYLTAILRLANSPVSPFDFRLLLSSIEQTLTDYQARLGTHFDLAPATADITALRTALDIFYDRFEELSALDPTDPAARSAAAVQRELARLLVPINYSREGRFAQDPAETVQALPDLAIGLTAAILPAGSHQYQAALVSLQRGLNRLRWTLRQATTVALAGGREAGV